VRVLAGREKKLNLYGPPDFIEQVRHKLHAYRWNLVDRYVKDLVLCVTEVAPSLEYQKAMFRLKNAFAVEPQPGGVIAGGVVCSEPRFSVSAAVLDHGTPCLAFAVQESAHVNVWKTRLLALGFKVGPWLRDLKRAIVEKRPDDYLVRIGPLPESQQESEMPLGTLRSLVTVTPGQKIAYVTDTADTASNRAAIIKLVQNADVLFIEAVFSQADASLAAERAHLTAMAAGCIAREAGARQIEPFHFSPRYAGEEKRLLNEALAAFAGVPSKDAPIKGGP
jgi:ribonuclease Z